MGVCLGGGGSVSWGSVRGGEATGGVRGEGGGGGGGGVWGGGGGS